MAPRGRTHSRVQGFPAGPFRPPGAPAGPLPAPPPSPAERRGGLAPGTDTTFHGRIAPRIPRRLGSPLPPAAPGPTAAPRRAGPRARRGPRAGRAEAPRQQRPDRAGGTGGPSGPRCPYLSEPASAPAWAGSRPWRRPSPYGRADGPKRCWRWKTRSQESRSAPRRKARPRGAPPNPETAVPACNSAPSRQRRGGRNYRPQKALPPAPRGGRAPRGRSEETPPPPVRAGACGAPETPGGSVRRDGNRSSAVRATGGGRRQRGGGGRAAHEPAGGACEAGPEGGCPLRASSCRLRASSCPWPLRSPLPKMAALGVNKVGAGAGPDGGRGPGGSGRGPAGAAVKVREAVRPFAPSWQSRLWWTGLRRLWPGWRNGERGISGTGGVP